LRRKNPEEDQAKAKYARICESFSQLIVPDRFTAFADVP
jgi:hypothetical protein